MSDLMREALRPLLVANEDRFLPSDLAERFRNIFDAVKEGIFISDPRTGRYVDINEPGCLMFGYTRAEMVGSDIGLLSSGIHPYTVETAMKAAHTAQPGGVPIFEWQCKTKSGALFWTEMSVSYLPIDGVPAIVAIVRDTTERRRHSDELKAALQEASAASLAKSEFLATMSHELRTPLNAIIGFSEILGNEMRGPLGHPKYLDYAGDIHSSGMQLLSLINDLLDLSQIDAGKANVAELDVSLHRVVADAHRMVVLQAERARVLVTLNLPADLPYIRGDERRINQVVRNLLTNAIKFTPEGGTVGVAAELLPEGLQLRISDTGIGIAARDIPVVLTRFGQVDSKLSRQHKGTGLGLPLAKQLVELHGGTLRIESTVGEGTTVFVTFPKERIIAAARTASA